jgi:hypothetical protein
VEPPERFVERKSCQRAVFAHLDVQRRAALDLDAAHAGHSELHDCRGMRRRSTGPRAARHRHHDCPGRNRRSPAFNDQHLIGRGSGNAAQRLSGAARGELQPAVPPRILGRAAAGFIQPDKPGWAAVTAMIVTRQAPAPVGASSGL